MKVMLFDGSMEELLMAVYHVYLDKFEPILVRSSDYVQNLMDEPFPLTYDPDAFMRVRDSMHRKFTEETLDIISYALNHRDPDAATWVLKYIIHCFKDPKRAFDYQNSLVMRVTKLSRQVSLESHRFTGFVRFSLVDSLYVAKIDPDHDILEFIAPHFAERFPDMNFIIYDEGRHTAILSRNGEWTLKKDIQLNQDLLKTDSSTDKWREYFNNISIAARENRRAQKRSMPKRYWKNLPETQISQDELSHKSVRLEASNLTEIK